MSEAVRFLVVCGFLIFGMGATGDVDSASALGLLREFGFPVFVAVWFMWRVEKRMDRFTDVVQNLLTTVTVMAKTIDAIPAVSVRANTHSEKT